MQIRQRRNKDLGACARLMHVVFYADHYPEQWPDAPRRWLADDSVLDAWVAEELGEILGHVAISRVTGDTRDALRWREVTGHDPAELACVSRFFVRPRVRGEGIGTALLDVASAAIASRGLMPVLDAVAREPARFRVLEDRGWKMVALDPLPGGDRRMQRYRYAAARAAVGAGALT
jgi:GNAT superfamily N-acetyltransferase